MLEMTDQQNNKQASVAMSAAAHSMLSISFHSCMAAHALRPDLKPAFSLISCIFVAGCFLKQGAGSIISLANPLGWQFQVPCS